MNWILIVILVGLLFFLAKARYLKHKVYILLSIVLVLLFYISVSAAIAGHDIDLNSISGWESAGRIYFSWLGNALSNMKVIAGNAVKMDWKVENVTLINESIIK